MPTLAVNQLTGRTTPISDDFRADVEMDKFVLDVVKNTRALKDIDISERITGGEIVQTMDGASTVKVDVHDPNKVLLNSGVLDHKIDITLDGLRFRLCAVSKNDLEISLTFEDFSIAQIRRHKELVTTNRNRLTRAEFVVYLMRRVKSNKQLAIVCPELSKVQPTASSKKEIKQIQRDAGLANTGDLRVWYAKGAGHDFTVRAANNAQLNVGEDILDVGVKMKAPRKVLIAAIATGMAESGMVNLDSGDRDSKGVFQQRPSQGWPASGDVGTDAKAFFDAAIAYAQGHDSATVQEIASAVQRPAASTHWKYGSASKYAADWVDAYGGASFTTVAYKKQVVFTTKDSDGKPRDWWTTIKDTMDEVNWAVFMANGTAYVIAEEDLIRSKPRMVISEETEGIDSINFDYDIGQPVSTATVLCRAGRWVAPPGTVVLLKKVGPASGRWLVGTITRPLFSRDTTIELKKADHSLKEPAADIVTRSTADQSVTEHHGNTDQSDTALGPTFGPGAANLGPTFRRGTFKYGPQAMGRGVALASVMVDFLELVAGYTSEDIYINYGTNHGQTTTSGSTSDHWDGHAVDLNVDGTATDQNSLTQHSQSKGDNIAIAAMRVCGMSLAEARRAIPGLTQFNHNFTWQGHRVQIGWRTRVGGNHFDHVHLGVR